MEINEKKKKVASSVTYTTGDPKVNIDHFNKMLAGKEVNTHTDGYMNGTINPGKSSEEICAKIGTFAAASPDGASSLSLGGGEGGSTASGDGGCCESLKESYENLVGKTIKIISIGDDPAANRYEGKTGVVKEVKVDPWGDTQLWGTWGGIALYPEYDVIKVIKDESLTEQKLFVRKFNTEVDIPDQIKIVNRADVEKAVSKLEPEEEFEVGYVTPIYFYSELDDKFDLIKCTELVGYTGIDYIEARADDTNKEQRIQIAKDTAELGSDNGVHLDRKPWVKRVGDFSANYSQTNKTVKQHADDELAKQPVYETILFYPKVGSRPIVHYYLDLHNGNGFRKIKREQLEKIILNRVAELATELATGVKKDGTPRKRRWDDEKLAAKIRKQLETDAATISAITLDKEDHYETRSKLSNGQGIAKPQVRALYTNQIYFIKTKHDSFGAPLTEALDSLNAEKLVEAKRYVRRYYIRPQNIFCSNKDEVLKALIKLDDENCSVYTLNNLIDNDDVTKLTNKDIIYYYDDGKLYDKNHVKVMDYDLAIKHEEERDAIDVDKVSDKTFNDVYDDRMTDQTVVEELNESQSQEIGNSYKQLSKMYNVDLEELVYGEDGFMKSCYPNGFEDFAGDVIYSEKYWDEFEKWLKDVKGIELKNTENELDLDFDDVNAFGESLKEGKEINGTCCICGEEIDGYGNNPEPYMSAENGRCCDACNIHFVIPARLDLVSKKDEE